VLHRAILTVHDLEWLRRFRQRSEPPPKVVLCFGPHTRYAELERWLPLVDAAVPEATALDTLPGRLIPSGEGPRPPDPRPLVCAISALYELRQTLVLACEAAGYPVRPAPDPSEVPTGALAVWDVPVLEPGWPGALTELASRGPVVTLLGFADRELIRQARAHGASACLELPFDTADLTRVLDRLALDRPAAVAGDGPHHAPPSPALSRRPGWVATRWLSPEQPTIDSQRLARPVAGEQGGAYNNNAPASSIRPA
jgi:hypothetical protein